MSTLRLRAIAAASATTLVSVSAFAHHDGAHPEVGAWIAAGVAIVAVVAFIARRRKRA